jgi:hypothetical protein
MEPSLQLPGTEDAPSVVRNATVYYHVHEPTTGIYHESGAQRNHSTQASSTKLQVFGMFPKS